MKMFICLAITCLLVGLLYVYVRQQLKYQNDQLEQLMGMVKCMVVPHEEEIPRLERPPTKVVVSDDESDESDESDDESESDESSAVESVKDQEITEVNDVVNEGADITELSTSDMVACDEIKEIKMDDMASMLNIIGVDISCMLHPVDLETLSVKELRSKVAEVGGPTLKTKRDMIQYLSSR
jgi:hypothetical protein